MATNNTIEENYASLKARYNEMREKDAIETDVAFKSFITSIKTNFENRIVNSAITQTDRVRGYCEKVIIISALQGSPCRILYTKLGQLGQWKQQIIDALAAFGYTAEVSDQPSHLISDYQIHVTLQVPVSALEG